jgi:ribokinase
MKIKIFCIGGVLQEIIYNTDNADVLDKYKGRSKQKYIAFDFGSKISSNNVFRSFGGGAMNSAVSFRSMKFDAYPVSIVGDDLMGHAVSQYLAKKRISTKYIKLNKNNNTAFSFILNLPKIAEHIIFVSQGVLPRFKFNDFKLSGNINWLYITSLRGPYANFNIRSIFNLTKRKRIKVFWNPGQQQIDNFTQYTQYLSFVDILSVNLSEARVIAKVLKVGKWSIAKFAEKLISLGCAKVIITDGKKGVYYFDKYVDYKQTANKVDVRNTTGAGDAFNAGFLSAFIHNSDIKKALEFGVKNAASVLQTIGAHDGVLTKKDL